MKVKKNFFQRIIMKLRGIIWQEIKADGSSTTLYNNGYVVIRDADGTTDILPIVYCSQEFVDRVEKDLMVSE